VITLIVHKCHVFYELEKMDLFVESTVGFLFSYIPRLLDTDTINSRSCLLVNAETKLTLIHGFKCFCAPIPVPNAFSYFTSCWTIRGSQVHFYHPRLVLLIFRFYFERLKYRSTSPSSHSPCRIKYTTRFTSSAIFLSSGKVSTS
jgi:hypothetical protein